MSNTENTTPQTLSAAAAGLRLYDTATHSITPFEPIKPGEVSMYVCGATVDSSPHVGHLRAAVSFDVIRRWFTRLGYKVTLIRNVTDIDDKILDKAAAAGQRWWARAYHYEREFSHAYDTLGVIPPTYEPRATGHMNDMIALVQRLIDRGHAYVVPNADGTPSGNVYFDVPSWPAYGELTHQEQGTKAADEDAEVADRMGPSVDATGPDKYNPVSDADASPDKHDPRDFALWKAPKASDPADARWDAPFGAGRPGWHLECSTMAHRYLGDEFDIHGGGLDLRFPHHENEMAQSRAAGWGFAHRWMHLAWVTAKGEKMSKSLGTGLSIQSVMANHSAWVVRYALAAAHYRSMLEWSEQSLVEAEAAHDRIVNFVTRAGAALGQQPTREAVQALGADELPAEFTDAMNNDITVPTALGVVFSTIRSGNSKLAAFEAGDESLRGEVANDVLTVRAMLDVFGLDPLAEPWLTQSAAAAGAFAQGTTGALAGAAGGASGAKSGVTPMTVLESLIQDKLVEREQARRERNFSVADAIRDHLRELGVTIEDKPQGPSTWKLE